MRELTYYVAVSLDGFIAGPDGQTDALNPSPPMMEHIVEVYPETLPTPARLHLGVEGDGQRFDAVVMGRDTYRVGVDQGLTSPYAHLDQTVFSSTIRPDTDPGVTISSDDPLEVVRRMKRAEGSGIWLCGGGRLAASLVTEIDELILKRVPVVLGAGRSLLAGHYQPTRFELVERTEVGPVSVDRYRCS